MSQMCHEEGSWHGIVAAAGIYEGERQAKQPWLSLSPLNLSGGSGLGFPGAWASIEAPRGTGGFKKLCCELRASRVFEELHAFAESVSLLLIDVSWASEQLLSSSVASLSRLAGILFHAVVAWASLFPSLAEPLHFSSCVWWGVEGEHPTPFKSFFFIT